MITKNWKQPKCPSVGKPLTNCGLLLSNKNKLLMHTQIQMNLRDVMLSGRYWFKKIIR